MQFDFQKDSGPDSKQAARTFPRLYIIAGLCIATIVVIVCILLVFLAVLHSPSNPEPVSTSVILEEIVGSKQRRTVYDDWKEFEKDVKNFEAHFSEQKKEEQAPLKPVWIAITNKASASASNTQAGIIAIHVPIQRKDDILYERIEFGGENDRLHDENSMTNIPALLARERQLVNDR